MKTPKFLTKLSAVLTPRPKKRLQATARAARPAMDDYDSEEPTTKLSSAFIVVLILHVVAVAGIYAFNSIKASRRDRETVISAMSATAPAAPAPAKSAPAKAPAKVEPAGAPAHAPVPAAAARTAEAPAPVPVVAASKPAAEHYVVKAGDNLTKIAFAYKVTPAELMEANHLKDAAKIQPGQSLVIPTPKPGAKPAVAETRKVEATPKQADVAPTKTTPGFYTVKKGDTPTSIAKSFGLTVEDLLKVNKITDPKKLQLGQTLKVPPRKS